MVSRVAGESSSNTITVTMAIVQTQSFSASYFLVCCFHLSLIRMHCTRSTTNYLLIDLRIYVIMLQVFIKLSYHGIQEYSFYDDMCS